MKRDDISGLENNEIATEKRSKHADEKFEIDQERRSIGVNSSIDSAQVKDGRALFDKYSNVKEVLEKVAAKREKEAEVKRMLEAKINTLVQDIVHFLLNWRALIRM